MKTAALLLLVGSPLAAQTFTPPAGCDVYLTVQKADCEVDQHFICEADPEGVQNRVSFDQDRMVYFGTIDAETQWITSHHMLSGHTEELEPNPTDPASFTELLETGADTYDFQTLSAEIGKTRYVGSDRLTGKTVEIDGITLDETKFEITAFKEDGQMEWQAEGTEYISREWRMFISGFGQYTTPTDRFEIQSRPLEMIKPNMPGFLSITPKYGCETVLSAAPELQEYSHDNL